MRFPLAALVLGAAVLAGCAGGNGTMTVQGTDPNDNVVDFSSLVVQLGSFTIHRSDGNEQAVSAKVAGVDVVQLEGGNLTTLAKQDVAAGNYSWIKMGVTSASGTLKAGGTASVDVPSDTLKLNGPFAVAAGQETKLTVQLHVLKTGQGSYKLTPVIGNVG